MFIDRADSTAFTEGRNIAAIGLFGSTQSGSEILNLGLVDVNVSYVGSSSNRNFVGGLVGVIMMVVGLCRAIPLAM